MILEESTLIDVLVHTLTAVIARIFTYPLKEDRKVEPFVIKRNVETVRYARHIRVTDGHPVFFVDNSVPVLVDIFEVAQLGSRGKVVSNPLVFDAVFVYIPFRVLVQFFLCIEIPVAVAPVDLVTESLIERLSRSTVLVIITVRIRHFIPEFHFIVVITEITLYREEQILVERFVVINFEFITRVIHHAEVQVRPLGHTRKLRSHSLGLQDLRTLFDKVIESDRPIAPQLEIDTVVLFLGNLPLQVVVTRTILIDRTVTADGNAAT